MKKTPKTYGVHKFVVAVETSNLGRILRKSEKKKKLRFLGATWAFVHALVGVTFESSVMDVLMLSLNVWSFQQGRRGEVSNSSKTAGHPISTAQKNRRTLTVTRDKKHCTQAACHQLALMNCAGLFLAGLSPTHRTNRSSTSHSQHSLWHVVLT